MASSSRHPQTSSQANEGDPTASSSNSGGGLDRDELFEAPRLPAKLLGGLFRSWRSLLSNPLSAAAAAAADGARSRQRLIVASRRGVFEEEADVELLDTTSGGRVMTRVPRCAGISYPRNPPMRAHHGLVLLAGGKQGRQRLRVVDPATGAVTALPDHRESLVNFSVLGRAVSTGGGEEEGEYKVFTVTVDDDLVQSCKVLTLGVSITCGGGGGGGGGVWREAPKPPARVRCDKPWVAAAVADGVVYILAFHRRDKADWIAAYDLGTEQWRPGLLQGPPASGPVSGLTEADDGRLVAVSGAFPGDDTSSSVVELWVLVGCNADKQALWQLVCTVPPMSRVIGGGDRREKVEEPVWVLDGGRVAAVVWSPAAAVEGEGEVTAGERGCQNWVLRVYDPRTEAFEDVARLSNSTDVAIGVYTGRESATLI